MGLENTGISVIIPNYNGLDLFPHTLFTIYKALENIKPYEIIIVDDASTDDSVVYLREHHPHIKVLQNEQNSGFSVTVNRGAKEAIYPLLFILNSDIKLTPDYFYPQLKYFEKQNTFGVIGRIVGWDNDILEGAAKYPRFHGTKIKLTSNYLLKDEAEMCDGLYSMYLTGANALIRRDHYFTCGGLNEIFSPFYVEDVELSLRAWRFGFKCYYEHKAVCSHKTSSAIKAKHRKNFIEIITNRNKMYLHAIHLPRPQRYLYFLQLFPEIVARFFTGRWTYLKAISFFINSYHHVRRSRVLIQKKAIDQKIYSVKEVRNIILNSIKDKTIIRL